MGTGLYYNDNGSLIYAEHGVYAPDYTLDAKLKEEANGWKWFETRQEACEFFGVTEQDTSEGAISY